MSTGTCNRVVNVSSSHKKILYLLCICNLTNNSIINISLLFLKYQFQVEMSSHANFTDTTNDKSWKMIILVTFLANIL